MNILDIIGPVMIGPSSSHTAGAVRLAAMGRALLAAELRTAELTLYGSFARTCQGHGTTLALLGGLMGLAVDDPRLRESERLADEAGLAYRFLRSEESVPHPNTVSMRLSATNGREIRLRGASIGGGQVVIDRLNGVHVEIGSDAAKLVIFHEDRPGMIAALTGLVSRAGLNIATFSDFRQSRGGAAVATMTVDGEAESALLWNLRALEGVDRAVWIDGPMGQDPDDGLLPGLAVLAAEATANGEAFWARVLDWETREGRFQPEALKAQLARCFQVMREGMDAGLRNGTRTPSGLSGGDALRVANAPTGILGTAFQSLLARSLAVSEGNARMGRVVAAPTAGACGILPGVLETLRQTLRLDEERIIEALLTAGGVGRVIAERASIAGAEGGCQAECGTAAAMAAAAATELMGGDPEAVIHAAALALKAQLGLACDPVGGLVEVPCVKRNAFGASIAMTGATLALAGVRSFIPPDEVIAAMADIGRRMPMEMRETSLCGLATTPTGFAAGSVAEATTATGEETTTGEATTGDATAGCCGCDAEG